MNLIKSLFIFILIAKQKGRKMHKKNLSKINRIIFQWLVVSILIIFSATNVYSQTKSQASNSLTNKKFADDYFELDDLNYIEMDEEAINKEIRTIKDYYNKALKNISLKDTINARLYFDAAIQILNKLASVPQINKYKEFYYLAKSIRYDFENLIQNIEDLDIDSPQFIILDKITQIYENLQNPKKTTIQTIEVAKENKQAIDSSAAKKLKQNSTFFPKNIDIPLDDNEYVQKNIEFLTSERGQKFFKKWLERTPRWFPMIKRIANQENVPEEIVYLAMIESGLNPTIVSRAQAVGMWQFMRSTGEMYGLNANGSPWIDERRDPIKATTAAMKHLRDLYYMFGDWYIAFAAYNCGAGCVQRAKNKTKIEKPTFWDLYKNLPRETRNYVPLYIATAKIASSPSTYGIKLSELEFQKEFKYDTFTLNEPVSIEALANSAGITVQEFQQLNTELLKMTTPPDITEYTIRLPQGRLNEFAANFSKLTDEEKKPWITHIVQKRESLKSIANKYGITTNDLAAANGISSRSKIKTGTKLQIPLEKQPSAEENSIAKNNNAPLQQNVSNEKKEEYKTYSVQKGETLSSIANSYGITVDELKLLNDIAPETEHIVEGVRLNVPNVKPKNIAKNSENQIPIKKINTTKTISHKVKSGETLAKIADDYNVSIDDIRKLNKIKSNKLKRGQKLKIQVSTSEPYKEKKASSSNSNLIVHKVKRGESLGTIAARYEVTEEQIKNWNSDNIDGNKIYSGSRLKIYTDNKSKGSVASSSKNVKNLPKYYTIRKGDTLSSIANKFGVSINSIKNKNKKLNENRLRIGQKIRLQ